MNNIYKDIDLPKLPEKLTKEENVAAIKKACSSLGNIKVEIKHADNNFNDSEFASDVDKVKKIFGDDIVIIK